mgnify:CR=1 FL=1
MASIPDSNLRWNIPEQQQKPPWISFKVIWLNLWSTCQAIGSCTCRSVIFFNFRPVWGLLLWSINPLVGPFWRIDWPPGKLPAACHHSSWGMTKLNHPSVHRIFIGARCTWIFPASRSSATWKVSTSTEIDENGGCNGWRLVVIEKWFNRTSTRRLAVG